MDFKFCLAQGILDRGERLERLGLRSHYVWYRVERLGLRSHSVYLNEFWTELRDLDFTLCSVEGILARGERHRGLHTVLGRRNS